MSEPVSGFAFEPVDGIVFAESTQAAELRVDDTIYASLNAAPPPAAPPPAALTVSATDSHAWAPPVAPRSPRVPARVKTVARFVGPPAVVGGLLAVVVTTCWWLFTSFAPPMP